MCDKEDKHLPACRRAQTSRMLCLCLLVYVMYVMSLLSLSTLVMKVLKVYLSLYTLLRSHFVRELLYQEVFSLHPPSVTVDCVDCYRYNNDKFCIKFLLRFMPQMNSWFTEYTGFSVRSVANPSLW